MALINDRVVLLALALGAGCSAPNDSVSISSGAPSTGADGGVVSAVCTPGAATKLCEGSTEVSCDAKGSITGKRDCAENDQMCFPLVGCAVCVPNSSGCDANTTRQCNADGSAWIDGVVCDVLKGEMCEPSFGTCESPCKEAEASNSYIGCEYWPTPTLNASLDAAFQFAVVVANPQTMPANVTVTRGGTMVQQVSVAPGKAETIRLPYIAELKQMPGQQASVLLPNGAYKLVSNLPVTVYQFNPFDYKTPSDCTEGFLGIGGNCKYSYSNDASLLLPTHVLTGDYMVMARPSLVNERTVPLLGKQIQSNPGFVTIVGAAATEVDVEVTFTSDVRASSSGSAVTAYKRGQTGRFKLRQGDVLQLVSDAPTTCTATMYPPVSGAQSCVSGAQYDLTGTVIKASDKVAVYSGHDCDFVPSHVWACDHLEEALLPVQTWGKDFIVSATKQLRAGEPNVVRVMSAVDDNVIRFDPETVHAAATLAKGQMIEFEVTQSFRVQGSHALMVGQLLVGQNFTGTPPDGETWVGDPSLSLAVPSEQFRKDYTFVTPDTFTESYLNVTAPMDAVVTLDENQPVTGFEPVGSSGMGVARVPVTGGQHKLTSESGFGIVVYGFAPYTSYMYPGGLDLQPINVQ